MLFALVFLSLLPNIPPFDHRIHKFVTAVKWEVSKKARKTGGIYFEMHRMSRFHHRVFLQHDPLYHKQRCDTIDSPFSSHQEKVYNHEGESLDLDSASPTDVDKSSRMHTTHVLLFHTMSVNFSPRQFHNCITL